MASRFFPLGKYFVSKYENRVFRVMLKHDLITPWNE